jgi:hypothetical protein
MFPKATCQSELELNKGHFFLGEAKELGGVSDLPSRLLEACSLSLFHGFSGIFAHHG